MPDRIMHIDGTTIPNCYACGQNAPFYSKEYDVYMCKDHSTTSKMKYQIRLKINNHWKGVEAILNERKKLTTNMS